MSPYWRVVIAELRKLRGTLALRMAFVAPLLVVAVMTLQLLAMTQRGEPGPPLEAWRGYLSAVVGFWTFLMLPLYLTLQAALLAQLEHAHAQWKHLLALPLPRGSHALAKLVALIGLLALASIVLLLGAPVGGTVLMIAKPALGLAGFPPLAGAATLVAATLPAALCMVALQWWIALRWPSFTVAVAAGMSATVAGFLIGQSKTWGPWYPWSLPTWTLAGDGEFLPQALLLGLAGGAVVALLGLWDFQRRDVA